MTACHVNSSSYTSLFETHVNLVNRTRYNVITVKLAYRVFDVSNAQIGQASEVLSPGQLLQPDDTGTYEVSILPSLSEPANAVARVSCRVVGATLTGRKTWNYPETWPEKLRPITAPDSAGADKSHDGTNTSRRGAAQLPIQVTNAWNTLNGALFVHDTIVITGGDSAVTVTPGSFVLEMGLANGAREAYPGLATPAPTYSQYSVRANNGAGGRERTTSCCRLRSRPQGLADRSAPCEHDGDGNVRRYGFGSRCKRQP